MSNRTQGSALQLRGAAVSWFICLCLVASAEASSIRFAAIGDYGSGLPAEGQVASLIEAWSPDFIVTTGDNSYGSNAIDFNIGQFYSQYIGAYAGSYGPGLAVNRFFPSLGNHDYTDGGGVAAYLNYFTLPGAGIVSTGTSGKEHYYDFIYGPVHFFLLNSNLFESDGITSGSVQGQWLQAQLAASQSPWKVVVFHHAAYSSGNHGSSTYMQWPFENWGADIILTGHDHTYERIMRDDNANGDSLPYFVTGLGGKSIYSFPSIVPGSAVRYNGNYGSMILDASDTLLICRFLSIASEGQGALIDSLSLMRSGGCCTGTTGNVNMMGIVDGGDLALLVAYLTNPPGMKPVLPCFDEANVNVGGIIDGGDLALFVAYLTNAPAQKPVLPACP